MLACLAMVAAAAAASGVGVGVDIVKVQRIASLATGRLGAKFLRRAFHQHEINQYQHLCKHVSSLRAHQFLASR